MWTAIKNVKRRLVRRRTDVAIVLLWTALIVLIVIKAYWIAYATSTRLSFFKPPVPGSSEGPRPDFLDLLIILIAGVLVGLFLSDVGEMLYGYIASMSLSFVAAVVYVAFYIWYALGWGVQFSATAFEWEWALFFAIQVVFTIMFPWIIGICLVGVTVGAFLKTWIGWA